MSSAVRFTVIAAKAGGTILLLAILGVTGVGTSVAQEANRIIPVDKSVSMPLGSKDEVTLLIAPGVTSVAASASDFVVANLSAEGCGKGSVTARRQEGDTPTRLTVCIEAKTVGSGTIALLGDDGSQASISVTVKAMPGTETTTAPPSKLTVVTEQDDYSQTVTPGFDLPDTNVAIAGGPGDYAYIALSTVASNCGDLGVLERSVPAKSVGPDAAKVGSPKVVPASPKADSDVESAGGQSKDAATDKELGAKPVNVVVCGAGNVGNYQATFDLNGDVAGGALEINAVRRRPLGLAVAFALIGTALAWLSSFGLARLRRVNTDREVQEALAAVESLYLSVRSRLADAGLPNAAWNWIPTQWPAFRANAVAPVPEASDAAVLYNSSVESTGALLKLRTHLLGASVRNCVLEVSVTSQLTRGIQLTGADTPSTVAERLAQSQTAASTVLDGWKQLERAGDVDGLTVLKSKVLSEAAAIVTASVATTSARELGGEGAVAGFEPRPLPEASAPPDLPAPRTLSRRSLLWLTLTSWGLSATLFVVGVVAAVALSMGEALNPSAAWGTPADIAKVLGATLALPSLLEHLRKVLQGLADTAK